MILAIDFDGVLSKPHPEFKMGEPFPRAIEALQDLSSHHLIIHTTRANTPSGRRAVADWLEHFDIDYTEIAPKPRADYYIDDRAILHRDWVSTMRKLGYDL